MGTQEAVAGGSCLSPIQPEHHTETPSQKRNTMCQCPCGEGDQCSRSSATLVTASQGLCGTARLEGSQGLRFCCALQAAPSCCSLVAVASSTG